MMKLRQHSPGYFCEDDILIIARLTADGRTWINWTQIEPDQLQPLLTQVYEGRHERAIHVMADPSIPYGQFAEFLAKISSSRPVLHIVLLTEGVKNDAMSPAIAVRVPNKPGEYPPSCDLEWKENGYDAPSIYENDLVPAR